MRLLILLLLGLFLLGGCEKISPSGEKEGRKGRMVLNIKQRPPVAKKAPQKPKKEEKKEPLYVYDPKGKRDPFVPFLAVQEPVKPKGRVPRTPLQRYDLSQLKLVAILVGGKGGRAMVEDSEGKGYIIKKGTYVGKNYGRVKAILPDRVIIVERYRDYTGKIKTREVVLRLHTPGEGKK